MDGSVKNYTSDKDNNTHYTGVPSMYGKLCKEQYDQQPKYCEPGPAGGGLQGSHSNTQAGP